LVRYVSGSKYAIAGLGLLNRAGLASNSDTTGTPANSGVAI